MIVRHIGQGAPLLPEQKDPDAVWDIAFAWGEWLGDGTIASADYAVSGVTGVSRNSLASATIGGVTYENVEVIRVSGGTAGSVAEVTSKLTTAAGLVEERTVRVKVAEQ